MNVFCISHQIFGSKITCNELLFLMTPLPKSRVNLIVWFPPWVYSHYWSVLLLSKLIFSVHDMRHQPKPVQRHFIMPLNEGQFFVLCEVFTDTIAFYTAMKCYHCHTKCKYCCERSCIDAVLCEKKTLAHICILINKQFSNYSTLDINKASEN